jgi:hypothetical protein
MRPTLLRLFSVAAFALCAVTPSAARADQPAALSLDVTKVIESSYAWFAGRAKPVRAPANADKPAAAPASEKPVLNPPLRMSLVARDWSGAYDIAGGTMVSDDVRLSRSSRMVLTRVRADLGRVQPYLHAGIGEWRYDPAILTLLPRNQEYATQLAAGFELRVAKYARLAVEADYTILCRETREPQNNPVPRVLGAYAVLNTKF